jgi:hypothetical protein
MFKKYQIFCQKTFEKKIKTTTEYSFYAFNKLHYDNFQCDIYIYVYGNY